MSALLPADFADLEPFAAKWCLASEAERYDTRLASTMSEMQAFYDAMMPRAQAAIAYCDGFSLDALPEDVLNLLHLIYSLVQISFPVEAWSQPRVPDTGATTFGCYAEPRP